MCKYCNEDVKLIEHIKTDLRESTFAFVDDDDKQLTIGIEVIENIDGAEESDNLYIDIGIRYCPMCGRKL